MGKEPVLENLLENAGHGARRQDVEAAYDAGVAAERERCAKLCEVMAEGARDNSAPGAPYGDEAACEIRKGDACHYRDTPATKGWPVPAAEPVQEPVAAELPPPQLLVESAQGFVEGWTRSQVRSAINLALLNQRYAAPQQREPLTEFKRMQIIGDEFPLALVEPIIIQKIDSVCLAIERAIIGDGHE